MRSSFVLLSFALSTLAKPLSKRWTDVSEKHSWSDVPQGWVLQSAAPADYKMELRIGLKSHRMNELINTLQKVSDPNHESYGEHLTAEQVNELVAPHSDSLDLVDEWLAHHGIDPASTRRTSAKDWITVTVTVAQAEKMLDTTYNVFHHPESSDSVVRTMAYNLPSVLHNHVDVVSPTTYMGTTRSITKQTDSELQSRALFEARGNVDWTCGLFPNAGCLRELYNTAGYTPSASAANSIGVVGYEDQFASHSDLKTFFDKYRPDVKGVANFTTIHVNGGGNDESSPGIEANMNMQYAQAISYPVKHVYYSVKGTPPYIPDDYESKNVNDPYLDFLDFILTQNDVPQVLTTSYSNEEQTVPRDYAQKVCDGFAQLGARGVSVLFSSGNNGVGAGFCHSNDGSGKTRFQPKFPPSCPWVTAVGGTTNVSPEKSVDFSGGGFSNYFTRPDYQNDAVAAYAGLLGTKYDGMYNKTGRGYPDVAAQAWGTPVVVRGFTLPAGGTSVATPTVAGVIALLNDYRLSIGKKPLGFLNPWLYTLGKDGFNDIVNGHNAGCGTDGFSALKGWDPISGWGTPDFLKLKALM